jgi:hypothetical protein
LHYLISFIGTIGLVHLDWRFGLAGGLLFGTYAYAVFLVWPALAWLFILAAYLLLAWKAGVWTATESAAYLNPEVRKPSLWAGTSPFVLPLFLDLALLFLRMVLLNQVWVHGERGSLIACLLILCISTPVAMLSANALRRLLIKEFLHPLRANPRGQDEPN